MHSWSLIYSASRREVKSWQFLRRCLWPIEKKGQAADRYSTLGCEGYFTKSIFPFISGLHCPLMKQEGSSSTIDPWRRRRRVALMGLRLALVSKLSGQQAISRRDQGSRIGIGEDWGSGHNEYQRSRIGEDWGWSHSEYQRSQIRVSENWGWSRDGYQGSRIGIGEDWGSLVTLKSMI